MVSGPEVSAALDTVLVDEDCSLSHTTPPTFPFEVGILSIIECAHVSLMGKVGLRWVFKDASAGKFYGQGRPEMCI